MPRASVDHKFGFLVAPAEPEWKSLTRGEGAGAGGYAADMHYRGLVARDGMVPVDQDWTKLYGDGEVNWQSQKPRRVAAG